MLGFIFYYFITMSAPTKYEESNASGFQPNVREEKGRKKNLHYSNSARKGNNSRSQINAESKEGQNQSSNNANKNQNVKTGNKIKVLQNNNNNNNNNRRKRSNKKYDNKKELESPLNSQQLSNEVETQRFLENLKKLEEDGLFPLKRKSARFPRAKFFCRLCDYHCDSVEISLKHIRESRHSQLRETKFLERTLNALLPPAQAQYDAITELIEKVNIDFGLTDEEISQRIEIKDELEQMLKDMVKDTTLQVTGSTLSRFGLKSSNLDLNVLANGNDKVAAGILAVKKIIETNVDKYIEPVNDLSSSYPSLSFTHKKYGVRIVVGVYCATSRILNRMFGYYSALDKRVHLLGTAFRYWAKLCKIDKQEEGSLAAHCFSLMIIHFLQQVSPPVVPVLHEMFQEKEPNFFLTAEDLRWESQNKQSTGELWLGLFKFYALEFMTTVHVINIRNSDPFVRKESRWGKRLAIEDPFQPKRNQTHTVSSYAVFDYITSRIKNTYRYFVIPQMEYGPLYKQLELEVGPLFKATNTHNFTTEMDIERNWATAKPSSENEDEEEEEDFPEDEDETFEENIRTKEDQTNILSEFMEEMRISSLPHPISAPSQEAASKKEANTEIKTETSPVVNSQEKEVPQIDINSLKEPLGKISKSEAASLMKQLKNEMLHYSFNQGQFTGGKSIPLHCSDCQKSGHAKNNCVEHELPMLKPLPNLRRSYYETITFMFLQLKNECSPKPDEIMHRDYIVRELQKYIQEFFPKAVLKIFGSSANGFGFGNSDLDICLTFSDRPTGEDIDHINVIEEIARRMKRFREFRQVLAITTAKVPIVKFSLYRFQLEADLSLYNTLALQNTRLLSTYAAIDHRVKVLGYTMKYFAKLCDIGDASRGSLSSYAYILMVLHFLQQCQPAVLPVLQQLYDHRKTPPEHIIDGWNAWFYDDLNSLKDVWEGYGKNTQSIGELWVDLLRYYTEVFKWKENVISIRRIEPLSKLEKLWTTKCIAIEDPFDLSHNLGWGLSRKMNSYILTAFIKGREVFGSGTERPPYGYPSLGAFLFDKHLLTDGAPPNDRGCRWCGRIGHIVKECPRKQQKKDNKSTPKKNNNNNHNDKRSMRNQSPENKAIPVPVPPPKSVSTPKNVPPAASPAGHNSVGQKDQNPMLPEVSKDITGGPMATSKSNEVRKREGDSNLDSTLLNQPPLRVNDLISRSEEVSFTPASPPQGTSVSKGTEISPSMLFQLANRARGGNLRLPATPILSNTGYENPVSVPPPGFSANLSTSLPSSLITKGPHLPASSPLIGGAGGADLSRLFPNHEQVKTDQQRIWQQLQQQQMRLQHSQQAQMSHSQAQMQYAQHVQMQHQLQKQQLLQHQASVHNPQHLQQSQPQNLIQFQQPMQHMQMHSNSSTQPKPQAHIPPVPLEGNAFISHVMAQVSQAAKGQSIPPVIRPNWEVPFPSSPPGLNSSHSNYAQVLQQRIANPLSAIHPQQQQNRPGIPDAQLPYPLDMKDSPDILSPEICRSPSDTSSFQSQLFGSVKQQTIQNSGVPQPSLSNQILTGPSLSVPFPKASGNVESDRL